MARTKSQGTVLKKAQKKAQKANLELSLKLDPKSVKTIKKALTRGKVSGKVLLQAERTVPPEIVKNGIIIRPRLFTEIFDEKKVLQTLSKRDPKLGKLIRAVGSFTLKADKKRTPYQWLLRSIIFQQLNGRAAGTIHSRVQSLYGGRDPEPDELLATQDDMLRAAGLSANKLLALKDLARHAKAGNVPSRRVMNRMNDEEIIQELLPIRGVGRWTVEMLLIFGLGRADVLAVDDFALKKSAMLLYGLAEMPNQKKFRDLGSVWEPWRSIASWYLWRALDPKPGM